MGCNSFEASVFCAESGTFIETVPAKNGTPLQSRRSCYIYIVPVDYHHVNIYGPFPTIKNLDICSFEKPHRDCRTALEKALRDYSIETLNLNFVATA